MATFEYVCLDHVVYGIFLEEGHGVFEVFWEPRHDFYPCPLCGNSSEQFYFSAPSISPDSFWSGYNDPDVGYVTSRTEFHNRLEQRGLRIKEPGSDKAAESIMKDERKKQSERMKDKVGKMLQDRDIRQVQQLIKNDGAAGSFRYEQSGYDTE